MTPLSRRNAVIQTMLHRYILQHVSQCVPAMQILKPKGQPPTVCRNESEPKWVRKVRSKYVLWINSIFTGQGPAHGSFEIRRLFRHILRQTGQWCHSSVDTSMYIFCTMQICKNNFGHRVFWHTLATLPETCPAQTGTTSCVKHTRNIQERIQYYKCPVCDIFIYEGKKAEQSPKRKLSLTRKHMHICVFCFGFV